MRIITPIRHKTKEEIEKLLNDVNELIEHEGYTTALSLLENLTKISIDTQKKDAVYNKMYANYLAAFCLYHLVEDQVFQDGVLKSDLDLNTILAKLDTAYSYCQKAIKVMRNQPEKILESSYFDALHQQTLEMKCNIRLRQATICWDYSIPASSTHTVKQYTEYKENAEKSLNYYTQYFQDSLNPDRYLSNKENKEITTKKQTALALCQEKITSLQSLITQQRKEVNTNILEEGDIQFFPPLKRWKREFLSTEEINQEGYSP